MARTPKPVSAGKDALASGALDRAREALDVEALGLRMLAESLGPDFVRAVDILFSARGHTIVTGMGKSGHIAHKLAATLASTGTPAFFVHPGEASHGDLGMVTTQNTVIALSNSGETAELSDIIAYTRRHSIPLIGITGRSESSLARHSDVTLLLPPAEEACPHGLAPTTSTTMMLALGDALAIALLDRRGFSRDDFFANHPGGRLGALLIRVRDIMHSAERVPSVRERTSVGDALVTMSAGGFGLIAVLDESGRLIGAITDGDIRRNAGPGLLDKPVEAIMTRTPKTAPPDALASEALRTMNEKGITALFVVDGGEAVGLIHIHDCLRAGLG